MAKPARCARVVLQMLLLKKAIQKPRWPLQQVTESHQRFLSSLDVVNVPSSMNKMQWRAVMQIPQVLGTSRKKSWGRPGLCTQPIPAALSSFSPGCRSPPAPLLCGAAPGKQQPLNSQKASYRARAEPGCGVCCQEAATCWWLPGWPSVTGGNRVSRMVWCCGSVFVFTLQEGSVTLPGRDAGWDGLLPFWLTKTTDAAPSLRKGESPQDISGSRVSISPGEHLLALTPAYPQPSPFLGLPAHWHPAVWNGTQRTAYFLFLFLFLFVVPSSLVPMGLSIADLSDTDSFTAINSPQPIE